MATNLASSEEKTAPQHVAYLDGLRALAALFVIVHHCALQVNFNEAHVPRLASKIGDFFSSYGHNAVDVFIVLSGFCLALPVVRGDGFLRGGALQFFQKRARRILPPYFLAMLFSLLLIWLAIGHKTGTHWDYSLPVNAKGILTHLLLVQDLFRDTSARINHAFWSISVEWRIYFLFPLLIMLRRSWGSLRVAAAAAALSYTVLYIGQHTAINAVINLDPAGASPQYLGLFTLGLLGADIAYGTSKNGKTPLPALRRPAAAALLLGATTLLMAAASKIKVSHGQPLGLSYTDFFVGLWAASLLIAASNEKFTWLSRALSWRPFVFLGTFAYSIYLIHGPLIQILWQYVLFPLQGDPLRMFCGLCFVGVPLIIGVSYLFFLACERPFLTTRKRETLAETERDAALSPAP